MCSTDRKPENSPKHLGATPAPPSTASAGHEDLSAFHHPPRTVARQSSTSYAPEFLRSLEARNEVEAVPEDWDHDPRMLKPTTQWVIYPNGDLERVSIA